jgi:hypothetical protein
MPDPSEMVPEPSEQERQWRWRYERELLEERPLSHEDAEFEEKLDRSWFRLQVIHTPFRATDRDEHLALTAWLKKLEEFFLDHPDLEVYYRECFADETRIPLPPPVPALEFEPTAAQIDHIAASQARFMEEVFSGLQLGRYGNAPDNRGWMNLFRRWGRSQTFNRRLDRLRSTLTLNFLEFYDLYLRHYTCRIDEHPIPHPWDPEDRRKRDPDTELPPERSGGEPGPCEDVTGPAKQPPPEEDRKVLPGLFLDSGVREAKRRGTRSGERPLGQPGTGSQGVEDAKGAAQSYETPPPSGGEPSGEPGPAAPNE